MTSHSLRTASPSSTVTAGISLGVAAAAGLAMAFVAIALIADIGGGATVRLAGEGDAAGGAPSAQARADIPPAYLSLYREASRRYGIDWRILAAIGKVECDHGRDPDPSCSKEGSVNPAGAGGPMQFLSATWQRYGVDGDGDARRDRWDRADAIYSAANYLRASGAPRDYGGAIWAYNHAAWYVREVEAWARRYGAPDAAPSTLGSDAPAEGTAEGAEGALSGMQARTTTPIRLIAGDRARLAADDGHLALIPVGVPLVVQALLVAGNELQEEPYGPGGHPDPLGAYEEDCSSTINYLLYRAGIRSLAEILRDNPLAQDYVRWGAPGPGRWVTIYATDLPTQHVFATIASLRIDTSHNGTDVGPNREQDGPRWRISATIPAWAHWSIRHPPGL